MYGIVILAGMTAGSDNTPIVAPAAPVVYGCGGCYGSSSCYGVVSYGGCYGSSCYGSSCYGSSCYGSCHGGCHGGGLFGRHHKSCHGGGYNCSGYNCFSSCYGSGYLPPYSMGCYGSCQGYGGCYGAVYGGYMSAPVVTIPVETRNGTKFDSGTPKTEDKKDPKTEDKKDPKGDNNGNTGASLKFQLPANAKLYVDGRLTTAGGTERSFFTPPLQAGQQYYYEVKAELTVGGETVIEEKRVVVSAGSQVVESFPKLTAAVDKANGLANK